MRRRVVYLPLLTLVLVSPLAYAQGFTETTLVSGVAAPFSIPVVTSPVLNCCFRIEAPAGATRLEFRVAGAAANTQFALAVRFGAQPISSPLTADYPVVVGNNPLVITAASNPTLRAGTYYIGVAVVSSSSSQSATMTATVTAETAPRVAVSAINLNFMSEVGVNPPAQDFSIRNTGGGTLDFRVTTTAAWLSISPAAGVSTGQAVAMRVSAEAGTLPAGAYDAMLRITATGIAGTATVPVRLVLTARTPAVRPIASVSAASLRAPAAPASIVSSFGAELAAAIEVAASADLPELLGETKVSLVDSAGVERTCQLFFVAPGQVNFLVPSGAALGMARVRILRNNQPVAEGGLQIDRVAPAIFTANSSGQGVAAAQLLRIQPDGTQTLNPIFSCAAAGNCAPVAIDPSGGDQLFLLLYGTGLRGRTGAAAVGVTIAGQSVESSDAVAQGQFLGLDQINVRLTPALAGRGVATLIVTIDGRASNTVTVQLAGAPPAPPPAPARLPAVPSGRVYQPVAPGMQWTYRVTFPQNVRIPHRPLVEMPDGLLCSNVFCGLQSWNAGTIEFNVNATDLVSTSGAVELWNANVTGRGGEFFFPTVGPIQIRRRFIDGGANEGVQLELVHTPSAGLRLVRPLARPAQSALNSGILTQETLTVPAGTYRNIVTTETLLTGDAASGFTGTYRTEVKLAPYVGIARAVMRDPAGQILYTMELVRFTEPAAPPAPRFWISNLAFGPASFNAPSNSSQLPIEFDFEDPDGSASSASMTIGSNLDDVVAGGGTLSAEGVTPGQPRGRMKITARFPLIRLVSGRTYVFTFVLRTAAGYESNPVSGSFVFQ